MKNSQKKNVAKKPLSILWVDDEPGIKRMASEMVKILGHDIDTAGSGKEALQYLDKKEYQLVITDIGMNEMDGWQLSDMIRQKFDSKIKIAIISGLGDQITEAERTEHGVDFKVDKPFTLAQLSNMLKTVQAMR